MTDVDRIPQGPTLVEDFGKGQTAIVVPFTGISCRRLVVHHRAMESFGNVVTGPQDALRKLGYIGPGDHCVAVYGVSRFEGQDGDMLVRPKPRPNSEELPDLATLRAELGVERGRLAPTEELALTY